MVGRATLALHRCETVLTPHSAATYSLPHVRHPIMSCLLSALLSPGTGCFLENHLRCGGQLVAGVSLPSLLCFFTPTPLPAGLGPAPWPGVPSLESTYFSRAVDAPAPLWHRSWCLSNRSSGTPAKALGHSRDGWTNGQMSIHTADGPGQPAKAIFTGNSPIFILTWLSPLQVPLRERISPCTQG